MSYVRNNVLYGKKKIKGDRRNGLQNLNRGVTPVGSKMGIEFWEILVVFHFSKESVKKIQQSMIF